MRTLLQWIWHGLDGLRKVLHLVLLLAIFAFVWAALSRSIPLVPTGAALVIAPEGPIVEQLAGDPFERALADQLRRRPSQTLLRDVVEAIDEARADERISALYLDLSGTDGGGLAKLREIGAAIDAFRTSGKPVIAYGDFYDQRQYYLAARASEVYLDPQGIAFIEGYGNYGTFLKDALDKLAVDWNVFRVGEFKAAVETFTRNDMSPAEREESLDWLGEIWDLYKADVAKARGIRPEDVQSYADDAPERLRRAGGSLARMALEAKLVTRLAGRSEAEQRLAELTGTDETTHSYQGVDLWSYLGNVRSKKALDTTSEHKVGVVVAAGEILPGEQPPGTIGSDSLVARLRDARFDDSVKALVLRIDSPGGSSFASDVIYRELLELRRAGKPVVASMSSTAASGGYYIAAAADRIVASPATLTGSIGIFAMFPTFQRTLEKVGVHTDGVGTTELAGEFRPDRPLGPEAREILQQNIEYGYRDFLAKVAAGRRSSPEKIDAVAQGRVWAGTDARRLGLVDRLGDYDDAVALAAELAGLGEDYDVEVLEDGMGLGEAFGLRVRVALAGAVAPLLPKSALSTLLDARLSPLAREAGRFARLVDPRHLYAYCVACTLD